MTTNNTPRLRIARTFQIHTGKRIWTLRVVERRNAHTWLVETVRKDGKAGKLYTFCPSTKSLQGIRKTREGGERLYNWHVTKVQGLEFGRQVRSNAVSRELGNLRLAA